MFCNKSHTFSEDEKKFDKYLKDYGEKQREYSSLNINCSYHPTIFGSQKGMLKSSRYHTFLSELAKGSYLKNNRTKETSQCYEGFMSKSFSTIDTQVTYSEVKNISGNFIIKEHDRDSKLHQLAERLLEEPNLERDSHGKGNNLQNTITRSFQEILSSENSTQLQTSKELWNLKANNLDKVLNEQNIGKGSYEERHNLQNMITRNVSEFLSNKNSTKLETSKELWNLKVNGLDKVHNRSNSIDKHIKNCYECIKKISERFGDILHCNKNKSVQSYYATSIVKKTEFDIIDKKINNTISTDSVSVIGHFLNTSHGNNGSQNRLLFINNSENLNNKFSSEENDDYSYYIRSDRQCSLRNLFSSSEVSKDKKYLYNIAKKQSKSLRLEFTYDQVIKDEEYKEWLKRNNFLNYTRYCTTNSSEISRLMDQEELSLNYSAITSEVPLRYSTQFTLDNELHQSQSEYYRDGNFMDIHCYNIYEMIIYEHLVVIHFLKFFTSYFSVRRIRKLTVNDHLIQIIFFAFCYCVFIFVKNSGIAILIN